MLEHFGILITSAQQAKLVGEIDVDQPIRPRLQAEDLRRCKMERDANSHPRVETMVFVRALRPVLPEKTEVDPERATAGAAF